ncbi:MAG: YybH family protein [Archangium sp.]
MRTMFFVIAFSLVMGIPGTSRATEAQMRPSSEEMGRADDEAAILQAMQGFAEGSIRADPQMMMDLWDARVADQAYFIPVEIERPLIGFEAIRAYYEGFMRDLIVLSGDLSEVQIHIMGDMAYASCQYNWVTRSVAGGPAWAQPTRATIILRKHGQRWLYLHFHESITYQYDPTAHQ